MSQITRRTAAGMLVAAPLAACGQPPQTPAENASTPDVSQSPPGAPGAALQMDDELEAMVLAFETDENWAKPGILAAPADVALDRLKRAEAISEVRTAIDKRNAEKTQPYFYWPSEDVSVDYHHFVTMGGSLPGTLGSVSTAFLADEFDLTHDVLQRMADANHFDLAQDANVPPADQRVIFALRGCRPVKPSTAMTSVVKVRESQPDHRDYNCTIGVWNQASRTLAVFEGSTVPSELHLAIFQQWMNMSPKPPGDWKTCMLPQGLHRRRVGTFRETAKPEKQLPRTLRQRGISPTPVLRPLKAGDALTVDSNWDGGPNSREVPEVGAHIHAALLSPVKLLKFSSQGCITVSGNYGGGQISDFQDMLGLKTPVLDAANVYRSASDDQHFPLMLLSGREARLHAAGVAMEHLKRVRLGSTAPPGDESHIVRQVLTRVGETLPAAGKAATIGPSALMKIIQLQERNAGITGVKRDGVIGPVAAKGLGSIAFPT